MKKNYALSPKNIFRFSLTLFSSIFLLNTADAQLQVTQGVTANQLIQALIGGGLTISNVQMNCPTNAEGTFSNGSTTNLGLNNGILLTSGSANNAIGPNTVGSMTTSNNVIFNDPDLTSIDPNANHDPCILEFDLVPQCDNLQIRFVFGSEEYPEFVNQFNDAFGFFITGPGPACQAGYYNHTNVALLPDGVTPVSINNVNNTNNSAYYVDNTGGPTIQYDGFTTVLTSNVALCPCQTYHFKIAVADAIDYAYDSGVFVQFVQCSTFLTATSSVIPTSGCASCDGSASITASGPGPFTYSWSPGNFTTSSISNACSGTYTVIVDDAVSCSPADTLLVTIPANGGINPTLLAQTNDSCNGDMDGTAVVSATGGSGIYTYSWSPSGGTNATATGLGAGTYTCTITDGSCTSQQIVTITQPPPLTDTCTTVDIGCTSATGSATSIPSGGTGPYTYSWSSGGTGATESNLNAGTYTVTVTDSHGCITTQTATISQVNPITATASSNNATCFGNFNGSATVTPSGGNPPYTYSWSPYGGTNATATGLGAGTFTCTITDGMGCFTQQTVTITQPTQLAETNTHTNILCNGSSTGDITITASGGTGTYTYGWSPNVSNSASASNLPAGSYTVIVTDANGCSTQQIITLTQPTAVTSTTAHTNVSCNGGSNGTATVTPSGGTPGYTYSWSPSSQTGSTATNLSAGTYTCTITDANGCTSTQQVSVTQPPPLTAAVTGDSVCPGYTAIISANGGGGVSPYTYSWSDGHTGATDNVIVTSNTNYTVTVTDANGCTTTSVTAVDMFPVPNAAFTSNTTNGVLILTGATGDLCLTDQSTGANAWLWDFNGNGTSVQQSPCVTLTAADTGIYCTQLIVASANNCIDTTQQCYDIIQEYYSIPNVFTPNADDNNDVFTITNVGFEMVSCTIYNRWGGFIYKWDSPTGYWDGKNKSGNMSSDGVYYYTATLTDFAGKVYNEKGFVQLLKGK